MVRISDEELKTITNEFLKSQMSVGRGIDDDRIINALQELKERRGADTPLDIKGQLRLVRDKCPEVWDIISTEKCSKGFGLNDNSDCNGVVFPGQCEECWNKALEGDE